MSSTLHKLGVATHRMAACPSDLVLDRLEAEELGPQDPHRAHVEACEVCQIRLSERDVPSDFRRPMLAAIREGAEARRVPTLRERLTRWIQPARQLALVASVASVVVLLMPVREDVTRAKGGISLTVYRERGGHVTQALSGAKFAAGDRLRFEVELPEPGHLMIVGVEQSGALFPCYPTAEHSVDEPATEKHVLPGAVQLDGSSGDERLHAILCSSPFELGDVGVKGGDLIAPPGCLTTPFDLKKEVR